MSGSLEIPGTELREVNGLVVDAETGEVVSENSVERFAVTGEIQNLEQARVLLEAASSPQQAKQVVKYADAVRFVAEKTRAGLEVQNQAAELKIDAQRKGGEMLSRINFDRGGNAKALSRLSGSTGTRLDELGVTKYESATWQQVAQIPEQEYELFKAQVMTARKELTTALFLKAFEVKDNHRAMGTGENEWYTPTDVLDDVRSVLGEIDLDPASSEAAQKHVKAKRFFSEEEDGLEQEWHGKVFLNPPYAQPAIAHFADKMALEYEAGRTTEAIMLTHNYTDTRWFHIAERPSALICFTRGRIRFVSANGDLATPTQGQAFFYYGPRQEAFRQAFAKRGFIR